MIPWTIETQAVYWADTYHQFTTTATSQDYLDVVDELEEGKATIFGCFPVYIVMF